MQFFAAPPKTSNRHELQRGELSTALAVLDNTCGSGATENSSQSISFRVNFENRHARKMSQKSLNFERCPKPSVL
jgi:hypothetical protein